MCGLIQTHTHTYYYSLLLTTQHTLHAQIDTELEIRSEKCSDTCQYKIKFALTFAKSDLTLVEIYAVVLYFGSDICQIKLGFVQVKTKKCLENV